VVKKQMSAPGQLGVAALAQLFHDGRDQLFSAVDGLEDRLQIEGRLRGIAIAGAVDTMLSDEDERVGKKVHRNGEAAALQTHHEFVALERVFVIIKNGHGTILDW
jgi:hypothetical protein